MAHLPFSQPDVLKVDPEFRITSLTLRPKGHIAWLTRSTANVLEVDVR